MSYLDDLEKDATAVPTEGLPETEALSAISRACLDLATTNAELEEAEAIVATIKVHKTKLETETLPELMELAGVSEFKTIDGRKLSLSMFASGKSTPEGLDWLDEHGHGDLIKNDLTLTFGKGEDEEAARVADFLSKTGLHPKQKRHVHPQTLQAFIKEQVKAGADFPLDKFNAFTGHIARLK